MACNCSKKVRPLGAEAPPLGAGTTTDTTTFYSPSRPTPPLGGGATYTLDGVTFGSRLEYDAARRRAGLF